MKLGLIGYPLGHSWSPEIHHCFLPESYQLIPLLPEQLADYLHTGDFDGLNVTIPYKQTVMPYLDEIDPTAQTVGAVNCIVRRNGRLIGYNTDWIGLRDMLQARQIDLTGGRIAVLGSGGAAKACLAALHALHASADVISRSGRPGTLSYAQLYQNQADYRCLINATPVGMYPECDAAPVDLNRLPALHAVVDLVANPLRTQLQFAAWQKGLQTAGGFEMLVRQAFAADELFTGRHLDASQIPLCMNQVLSRHRSIVLIGMPTSGKTTLAKALAEATGKPLIEMDDEVVRQMGMSIKQCFAEHGEAYFRQQECATAEHLRFRQGCIISAGGGVVTSENTMRFLAENGILVWIRRSRSQLFASSSRPLSHSEAMLDQMYTQREPLYRRYSDTAVDNDGSIREAVEQILKKTGERGNQL